MIANREFVRHAALAIGIIGMTACSAANSPSRKTEAAEEAGGDEALTKASVVQVSAPTKSEPALTETDRIMLKQAEAACQSDEFTSFFEAAVRSRQVRARYFASPIKTETWIRSVDSYSFPFEIMDHSYVVLGSAEKDSNDWQYVQLDFNQAQDERYRVDWVRINYGPNGNDAGATPEDDKLYGPRGYLIFKPTAECWALVEEGIEE